MKCLTQILMGAVLAGVAYAQPAIETGGVTNAASYTSPDLPGGALARGGMIVLKGTNLGPDPLQIINNFPLRTELGGTTVKATVGGTSVDLYMVYTSSKQVAAILPSTTPEGSGTITVSYNGRTSGAIAIQVVPSAFGIFTLNEAGSGPGIFQNANSSTDLPINTLTAGARPGQLVVLWGTGLGPVTQNEGAAPVPGDLPISVEVYVGGKRATVTYKGRSGCCAGIDQIVFTVPEGVDGCYVPVVVKTGNVVSNFTTMSISRNGGGCSDLNGLSSSQLETAQRQGSLRSGYIGLLRTNAKVSLGGTSIELKTDSGSAAFSSFDFSQLIRSQGISGGATALSLGACNVLNAKGNSSVPVDVITPVSLDAGPVININGPKGTKQLTKQGGAYTAQLSSGSPLGGTSVDYLDPGPYTIDNGSGGTGPNAVGAFRVSLTLPQLLNWTNMDAVNSINRASDLPITWTGGDPSGYVMITGTSISGNNAALFFCIEKTSAGQFSIPSYVLSTLPATTGQNIGLLTVSSAGTPVNFTAPGLDVGAVASLAGSSKNVTYR